MNQELAPSRTMKDENVFFGRWKSVYSAGAWENILKLLVYLVVLIYQ